MRDVVVLGVGMTKFGKFMDKSLKDLGREACRDAVRDQMFLGASQIKLFLGGGIASRFDLCTVQMTFEEIRAAVETAQDHGTYVMARLYANESMQRAVRAGAMSLEHTQLMNDETVRMIRDHGVWV